MVPEENKKSFAARMDAATKMKPGKGGRNPECAAPSGLFSYWFLTPFLTLNSAQALYFYGSTPFTTRIPAPGFGLNNRLPSKIHP